MLPSEWREGSRLSCLGEIHVLCRENEQKVSHAWNSTVAPKRERQHACACAEAPLPFRISLQCSHLRSFHCPKQGRELVRFCVVCHRTRFWIRSSRFRTLHPASLNREAIEENQLFNARSHARIHERSMNAYTTRQNNGPVRHFPTARITQYWC